MRRIHQVKVPTALDVLQDSRDWISKNRKRWDPDGSQRNKLSREDIETILRIRVMKHLNKFRGIMTSKDLDEYSEANSDSDHSDII